ncbi:hypothetical protein PPROV_001075000 [Pycnococcus provasolii]|uniref:Histone-lysine N-methyltransferase n=1 Tax=Pycnococcus provasolii TaxID=41880 RepID=A0A830HZ04_9CHLO|nr:hypothetical protein PPROV_001075000 [Pycnococcus provasolii]
MPQCHGAAASAAAAAAAGKNQNPTVLNVYLLRRNYFGSIPGRHHASIREADVLPCDCTASSGCSATSCLNRQVFTECIPGYCPCGPTCTNQMFSRRQYANLECKHTGIPAKGRGLFAKQSIPKGGFVIEYTGEVLDEATYVERKSAWLTREGSRHTYFMSLSAGEVIDASRMGNLGRFTNHSCAPNCEMQKWTVRGEVCIGIFATRDIQPGEEITMDYNFERYDERPMRCYCGESKCKGFVGGGADAAKNFERADVPTIELHADPEVEFTAADFEEEDEHLGMRRLLKMPEKRSSGAAAPRRPPRAGDSSDDSDYDDGAARRERRERKTPKQPAAKRAKLAPRLVENRKSEIERRLAEPGMMEKGYVARASLRTFVPLFTTAVRIDSDAYTETQRLPFSVKDLNILLDAIINIPRHDHRQELMAAGILQQIFLILRQRVMCVWSRQHDPNVVAVARKTLMALNSLPLEASKLRVVKNLEGSLEDLLKALMTGKGVDGQVAASARSILIKVGVEKSREELEREERKAEAAAAERRAEERRAANADSDHLRTAEPAPMTSPTEPRSQTLRPMRPSSGALTDVAKLLAEAPILAPGAGGGGGSSSSGNGGALVFFNARDEDFKEAVRSMTEHRVKKYCQSDHPYSKHVRPNSKEIVNKLSSKVLEKEITRCDDSPSSWEMTRIKLDEKIKKFVKSHIQHIEQSHQKKKAAK